MQFLGYSIVILCVIMAGSAVFGFVLAKLSASSSIPTARLGRLSNSDVPIEDAMQYLTLTNGIA